MIHCQGLVKIFKTKEVEVVALQGLDLDIQRGEMVAIIGSSGSGKSTLLNILGGLDRPSAGTVNVGDWNLLALTEQQYVTYKRDTVGFVWQNNARNLMPYLSALENVELPMILAGKRDSAYARALLDAVGLAAKSKQKLIQLSGGEQQRVAIAIALANRPKLVLADEPTGSVDSQTAAQIMQIFRQLNQDYGVTIVIVTHDLSLAKQVDRVVSIRDGLTSSEWLKRSEEHSHEELVVVDRSGRLQAPAGWLSDLGVTGRARLEWHEDHIRIYAPTWKDQSQDRSFADQEEDLLP
jgi:putative ABC transport system ATP-binding protein